MGNESSSQYGKTIENNILIKWEKDAEKCPFSPREGQACAVVGSKMYLFGGVTLAEGDNVNKDSESDELLVYDLLLKKWSKEICSGFCPGKRSGATLTAINKKLYLFGGLSQISGWMNDLFVYNTDTKIWKEVSAPNAPSPRDKVASAAVGNKLYIFGGFGPAEDDYSEEILNDDDDDEYEDTDELQDVRNCQEAANFTWSDQLFMFDVVNEKWSIISIEENKAPSPRAAHTLTYVKDSEGVDSLFVFGGRDVQSRQNDLWKFSISKKSWEECKGLGCQPEPRSFHAATAVEGRLVIFGGRALNNQHFNDVHIYDTHTKQWLQPGLSSLPNDSGDTCVIPPKMGLHSLCTVCECVVLFGGSANLDPATGTCTNFYNSVYVLPVCNVLRGGSILKDKSQESENNEANVPDLLNLKSTNPVSMNGKSGEV